MGQMLPLSILLGGNMLIKNKTYRWQALASLVMTVVRKASELLCTTLFAAGKRGFAGFGQHELFIVLRLAEGSSSSGAGCNT